MADLKNIPLLNERRHEEIDVLLLVQVNSHTVRQRSCDTKVIAKNGFCIKTYLFYRVYKTQKQNLTYFLVSTDVKHLLGWRKNYFLMLKHGSCIFNCISSKNTVKWRTNSQIW
jgi:hypothetical protein